MSIFRGHSLSSAVEGEGRRSFYALARLARAAVAASWALHQRALVSQPPQPGIGRVRERHSAD